ncbi:MAG: hypothetical protein AAGC49_05635 [Brevundimonas sp.]
MAYTPPAWMAQQAQLREETKAKLQSCMDAKGWHKTIDEWGGAAEPFTGADQAAQNASFMRDSNACSVDAGRPTVATVDDVRAQYQGELDIAQCLRSLGFEVPPAPPRDVWVEQAMAPAQTDVTVDGNAPAVSRLWGPFDTIDAQVAKSSELPADYMRTCPEWYS